MQLAIRDLWERAEPKLGSEVVAGVEELHKEVDAVRQARGRALVHFGRCHEYAGELEKLAECFESLGPGDDFARYQLLHSPPRQHLPTVPSNLSWIGERACKGQRRVEMGKSSFGSVPPWVTPGFPDVWTDLINKASSLRFPPAEGTYVCLRGARWCAWNGQLDKAQMLYRLATKLGSESGLDLDVENALWSLTALYTLGDLSAELFKGTLRDEPHGALHRRFSLLRESEFANPTAFVSIPGKSAIA